MKKPQSYYLEIISPTKAKELFKLGTVELFKVFDDEERIVESEHDLNDALDLKIEIGIERLIH